MPATRKTPEQIRFENRLALVQRLLSTNPEDIPEGKGREVIESMRQQLVMRLTKGQCKFAFDILEGNYVDNASTELITVECIHYDLVEEPVLDKDGEPIMVKVKGKRDPQPKTKTVRVYCHVEFEGTRVQIGSWATLCPAHREEG